MVVLDCVLDDEGFVRKGLGQRHCFPSWSSRPFSVQCFVSVDLVSIVPSRSTDRAIVFLPQVRMTYIRAQTFLVCKVLVHKKEKRKETTEKRFARCANELNAG